MDVVMDTKQDVATMFQSQIRQCVLSQDVQIKV
jgi:hypothetical protein